MADDRIKTLQKKIRVRGAPDSYIDEDEEKDIFKAGESLGIKHRTVEAVLNQMCRDNNWVREKEIIDDLRDVLEEATKDDGAIDQKEFEHCVNFAVSMKMPRKRAMELSVRYIIKESLSIKKKWLSGDWFEPLRRQYLK